MSTAHAGLILLIFSCFFPTPGKADDNIFNAGTAWVSPLVADLGGWFNSADRSLTQIIGTIFGIFKPDPHETDHPNPDENAISAFTQRISKSKFKLMVMGSGNLKMTGGPYLYNELQGGVGVEYDFISTAPGRDHALVALRVSPLYGEVAFVSTLAEYAPIPNLPNEAFLGSQIGIEISKRFGDIEAGARAYVKQEWEIGDGNVQGLSAYGALYARIRLEDAPGTLNSEGQKPGYFLRPTLNFYDRGGEKQDFYAYGLVRRFMEAMMYFEVKY